MANEIRIKVVAEGDRTFTAIEEKAKDSGLKTGKSIGAGIDEGLTSKSKTTGEKAGKEISSEVGRSLNSALRDLQLPEIDVKANAAEASAKLTELKEQVRTLASDSPTIEVKVRTDRAMSEISRLEKQLGETAGNDISSEVGRSLNSTLRDLQLPELDIKANATEARAKLMEIRQQVRALASDNPTIEVKVRTDAALSEISKLEKEFVKQGEKSGDKFMSGFTDFLSTGKGQVIAVLGGLAIAAAPIIGATISGAVIGAVGAGGIAGGIALAAKDPKVQNALITMRTTIGKQLQDAAKPFVDVTVKGVNTIGAAIQQVDFKSILGDSAKNLEPIIGGVVVAIRELGGAIKDVIANSGPVMREIGGEIGSFGKTLADGLKMLSSNGEEGAHALHDLFSVINGSIEGVFLLVDGLTKVYGALDKISGGGPLRFIREFAGASSSVAGDTKDFASAVIRNAIPAMDKYGHALGAPVQSLNELTQATLEATNANLGLFGSVTNVAKAEDDVAKAVKANGRTLDANTEKGRANRDALANLGRALQKNTEDYIAVNGVGAQSQKVMNNNRAAFLRAAQAMTGSKKAAEDLTNALFGIPNRDVYVNVHQVTDGPERVDQSGHRYGGYNAHGGVVGAAASGGGRSGLTMVGERGPEVLRLPPGTSVATAGDTARMFAGADAGYGRPHGGGPMIVNLELDGQQLATAMVDPQRHLVRTRFGGSVQAAYGQG